MNMNNNLQLKHYQVSFISTVGILGWVFLLGVDTTLQVIMMMYFTLDLLFFHNIMKPDMMIHHVLCFFISTLCYSSTNDNTRKFIIMEVSTPFLLLCRFHIYEKVNRILFLLSFSYFRIYQIGLVLYHYRYEVSNYIVWLPFILYLLNWYWFEIIIRNHLIRPIIIKKLSSFTPWSHCLSSLVCLYKKEFNIVGVTTMFSSITSYCWHHYNTINYFILDLLCLHGLAMAISWQYASCHYKFLSLPFHIADIFFYYYPHRKWLVVLSIGYDVFIVFFNYKKDFLWLFGWLLMGLFYTKQTFGHGFTQIILHLFIAFLLFHL